MTTYTLTAFYPIKNQMNLSDARAERLAGIESYGAGTDLENGIRDIAFEFADAASAEQASVKLEANGFRTFIQLAGGDPDVQFD